MTAVAVWDKHPTADELLERRVTNGWKPTPSNRKDGDVVEGHAVCLINGQKHDR
ncbi:MAG TPA: hypothetical protein PLK77_11545 [Pyrinomonadaceae bacterium]|nr:hypothetical protein [Pyrinomonadaceae bacterium]